MAERKKQMRLSQVARKLNIGRNTIVEHLKKKGYDLIGNPNEPISADMYDILERDFKADLEAKREASNMTIGTNSAANIVIDGEKSKTKKQENEYEENKLEKELLIKSKTGAPIKRNHPTEENSAEKTQPQSSQEKTEEKESEVYTTTAHMPKVVGKIDLDAQKRPKQKKSAKKSSSKNTQKDKPTSNKEDSKQPNKQEQKVVQQQETKNNNQSQQNQLKSEQNPKKEQSKAKNETENKPVSTKDSPKKEEYKKQQPQLEDDDDDDDDDFVSSQAEKLRGLKVIGKIDLTSFTKKKGKGSSATNDDKEPEGRRKRKRRRRRKGDALEGSTDEKLQKLKKLSTKEDSVKIVSKTVVIDDESTDRKARRKKRRKEPSEKEVQEQIKATLAKMSGGKSRGGKKTNRRDRREARASEEIEQAEELKTLRVTEYIPASDFANLMDVSINELISKGMELGVMISINQRLDADLITMLGDEFGYNIEFTSAEEETEVVVEEDDDPKDLVERAPIVTIMGHVDHGKTTLLDNIRKTKVAEGEAGGITQHIGAYSVKTQSGKQITFLDTPGHEAFTAMRARGAKVTDIVIIVVAADDGVMPQTREAINHAQLAGVPMVIAINKIDKEGANPDRIKQELADLNIIVEEWGGKYQSQEISAKNNIGIDELLEKVLIEAELLELKANPNRMAYGTVIEASLDKGRGYVTNVLVQNGTLKVGDVVLAGSHFGKVRAMIDHTGRRIEAAPPSTPIQILGLDGAPNAGDRFNVMKSDREAREVAIRREQILREQSIRATKRLTLSDIHRRLEVGNFQQLNLIIKGDVDGSVEALADSLQKLSTDEVEVNIVMKGVGQISESDVNLATVSDAIIIAFQVRPSVKAKALAEQEQVEIRMYSVIYKVIDDVKAAIVGMLAPRIEEEIVGMVNVREIFKISKIGTIAGCMVTDGYIKRNSKVRLIREGVVVHTGEIDSLKRYKDDVAEVKQGFECGLSLKNFNDIQVGDDLEVYEEKEVKRSFEELKNLSK